MEAHHLHEETLSVVDAGDFCGVRVDEGGGLFARQHQLVGTFRVGSDADAVYLNGVGELPPG